VLWSVAVRRAVLAVLVACTATGSEAQFDAQEPEPTWKVRILKDKRAAPSKASTSGEAAPKVSVSKNITSNDITSKSTIPRQSVPKKAVSKERDAKSSPDSSKAAASQAGVGATGASKVTVSKATASKGVVPWYRPIRFGDLPGWERDDHLAAFGTFLKSCGRVIARARDSAGEADSNRPQVPPAALAAVCTRAAAQAEEIATKEAARAFFEENFTPNAVVKKGQTGLLTGYYEPVLQGSRTPGGPYQTPIYKRPPDLVNVVDDTRRGALKAGDLTHVRKTASGTEPYFTRAEIEGGALKGKDLELLYFADPVEVFFMQIQGSGRVKLTDGTTVRVHYDGKNGHPYSSIGRYLIEKAILAADRMSMAALAQWLRADPDRGRKVMWQNSSYVFFREIKDDVGSPLGAMRVPLTPERSLAIDPSYHALGTPIYLSVPTMKHVPKASPFNRLMVGQDVGSAIRGAERGDIYFGSGDEAGRLAGGTKYTGRFFVLVPNGPPPATAAVPAPQKAQE
jgi:membrane-bound lytic murein transglycosylase A